MVTVLPTALGKNQALASSQFCGGCPEGQGGEGAESKGPAWPDLECLTQPGATQEHFTT